MKLFEFRSCAGPLRHDFLLRSTEQIVLSRTNQFAPGPTTPLVAEPAHNTKWRSIKLAAYQARSASQLVRNRLGAGVKHVTVGITFATMISQRLHASNPDGDLGQAFAPG